MLAVSNTSPISNLAIIGRLDLLKLQFNRVLIPEEVLKELAAHPDFDAQAAIRIAAQEGWLQIRAANPSTFLDSLLLQLHPGEAAAIALAVKVNADIVLIDEQEARRIAANAGLAVTGVLGVLLRAKQEGAIPAIRPEIDLLRSRARFFIAKSLETRILASAGE
jgi:uncharacterized protein